MKSSIQTLITLLGLLLVERAAYSGEFISIEVTKRTHTQRSNGYFNVEVSEGSYGRINFTVHVKKNPLDVNVSSGLSRIEIVERGDPVGWIPTERREAQDRSGHFLHFELAPQLASKCILVLVELTGEAAGNAYRVDLYSYTKEGEEQPKPRFDEIVTIEFPRDGYSCTLADAANGITLQYDVVVAQDFEGVIPLPFGPSFAEPPGPSGLHPRAKISGNGQIYCPQDFGLARPTREEDQAIKTLKVGKYVHKIEWDGRNWTGPSDTSNPKGKLFPAGTYDITVTIYGSLLTSHGRTPYEITRRTKLILK